MELHHFEPFTFDIRVLIILPAFTLTYLQKVVFTKSVHKGAVEVFIRSERALTTKNVICSDVEMLKKSYCKPSC